MTYDIIAYKISLISEISLINTNRLLIKLTTIIIINITTFLI